MLKNKFRKSFLLLSVLFCFCFNSLAQEYRFSVYFDLNKSDLTQIQINKIDSVYNQFSDKKLNSIQLKGFADTTGNVDLNQILAENRAFSVKNYLIKTKNVDQSIFNPILIGVPQNNNDLALDRRVEILFFYTEIVINNENTEDTSKIETTVIEEKKNLTLSNLEINYQEIISKQNISYWVPKDSAGNYPKISIEETIDQVSMQRNRLHTVSRNYNLESVYMSRICLNQVRIGDTVFLEIPKIVIERNPGVEFYIQLEDNLAWESFYSDMSKFYNRKRDSYLIPIVRTAALTCLNINLDKPIVGLPLIVTFDTKAVVGKKFFGLIKHYIYANPSFVLYTDTLNAVLVTEESLTKEYSVKNKVHFKTFNKNCSGNLLSQISLDYVQYYSIEHIEFADLHKRFGKYHYHAKTKYSKEKPSFVPRARSNAFAVN